MQVQPSAPSRIAASKDAGVFSGNCAEAYGTGERSEKSEKRGVTHASLRSALTASGRRGDE